MKKKSTNFDISKLFEEEPAEKKILPSGRTPEEEMLYFAKKAGEALERGDLEEAERLGEKSIAASKKIKR